MCVIFIFAHPLIRKRAYNLFWATHGLYIVLYALCLIHGLAKLTGEPRFWMFILIPGVIFALDKVINISLQPLKFSHIISLTPFLSNKNCYR